MDSTHRRVTTGVGVPPFSYTSISQSFKNAPFNEYPYAMACLRWFTESFDAPDEHLAGLRAQLLAFSERNRHFRVLQLSDSARVDEILDELSAALGGPVRGDIHERGPHEPGLGHWRHGDEVTERHSIWLSPGADRVRMLRLVNEAMRHHRPKGLAFDDLYLYPPVYGDGPERPVAHSFRIFAHSVGDDRPSAVAHLHEAVEAAVTELGPGTASGVPPTSSRPSR